MLTKEIFRIFQSLGHRMYHRSLEIISTSSRLFTNKSNCLKVLEGNFLGYIFNSLSVVVVSIILIYT